MKETMHMLILQHQILKAQKSLNHDECCYHIKQFIMISANSYCNIHILFIYYVLYFPLWTSTLYFPCFSFFLLIALESRCCLFKRFTLFRKRSIMGQLNVQAVTAENQEQYTLSNIMYIAFQNSYYFLRSFPW